MKFDVVIAGGGFAGAYCARALGKALGPGQGTRRVALISERNVLVFQPMLAEVVGSSLSPNDVVNPLRQFCRGVDVLQGRIQSIDWSSKQLVVDGGRFTRNHLIHFDHLVLALGSVTDLSRVPGLTEYGWPMKSVADALRLRAALINRLEEANLVDDPAVQARLLTFVIVGGGYTGVETAGQLHALITESKHFYANLRDRAVRVVLVHSQAQLLSEIGPDLGDYARQVLEKNQVEVRLNTRVMEATATRALLSDGTHIETATIVSTVGAGPNPVVVNLCQQLGIPTDKGRVPTEPSLRVAGQTHLWAAGDCAAVPWNDRGTLKVAPPTAQFALRQGRILGQNLAAALRGDAIAPFRYRYLGQLATIGSREAVAEVMGFHFRGFIAWWMWRTIYLGKLPGIMRKLRVVIDWTFELIFTRDISLMLPPPEDVLRAIHLEAGEALIEQGEKPRAFFYLRRGRLVVKGPDGQQTSLERGSVIDQAYLGENSTWPISVTASESSDVIVFRSRAFELLRKELRIVPQSQPHDPERLPTRAS